MELQANCFYSVFFFIFFFPYVYTFGDVFGPQQFGSLNLTTIPRNSRNIIKEASGLYCVDAVFDSQLLFFEQQPRFLNDHSLQTELRARNYFLQPTHVGKIDGGKETDSAILIVIQKSSRFELCYRSFAHLGGRRARFSNDSIVSWLAFDRVRANTSVSSARIDSYGCINTRVDAGRELSVSVVSLRHPDDVTTVENIEYHYDTVWIEWNTGTTLVCWEDNPRLKETHKPVTIQSLSVQPSSNAANGYVAGITNFSWPAGKNVKGVCVDIPYGSRLPAVPVAFASVNLQNDIRNNSYTTWVDSAGVDGLRTCIAESFWAVGSRIAGTPTYINYLAVINPLPPQTAFLETFVVLHLQGLNYYSIPYLPIKSSFFLGLLRNYLVEVTGVPAESIRFVDISDKIDEETIFFILEKLTLTLLESAKMKLSSKFGDTLINIPFPTDTTTAEYKFISRYSHGTPTLTTSVNMSTGCDTASVTYTSCSTGICGTPGVQSVSVNGSEGTSCAPFSFNQRCNLLPCTTKSATFGLLVDISKKLILNSGSSSLWLIIGIVAGVIVLVAVGFVGIQYYRRKKKTVQWGSRSGGINKATVFGKGLLSNA